MKLATKALMTALLVLTVAQATGCARIMGGLRRDLDDSDSESSPTVGGRWSERGQLNDEYAVGHSDRSPASYSPGSGRGSWIDSDQADSNRRDAARASAGEPEDSATTPNLAPPVRRAYKNGARATRADFVDESPNEGSLWASDGQTNYYFTKNKIRGVGDIVTVVAEDGLLKDTAVEVTRTLSSREQEVELIAADERLRKKAMGIDEKTGKPANAGAARAPASAQQADSNEASLGKVPQAQLTDIDVTNSMQFKTGDAIMAEILERYPNGNYKIRGTKRIPYRGSSRMVTLLGVVRGSDISEEDTVTSGKLYEYRLEVVR